MLTYDDGSLPFEGDLDKFLSGADSYFSDPHDESSKYFEQKVVSALEDKIGAGMDISCIPQFRDMDQMFVDMILSGETIIPEVAAIKNRSGEIYEKTGKSVRLKICITSPYTLANDKKAYKLLLDKFGLAGPDYYEKMSEQLSKIVEANVSTDKHCRVELITLDDPVLGLIDEPRLDHGGQDREPLIRCYEKILYAAKSKGAKTSIHLNNTSNRLFWDVESLDIVESHVDDPIYNYPDQETKMHIKNDKVLKASICVTIFDNLIRRKIIEYSKDSPNPVTSEKDSRLGEMVANEWKIIRNNPKHSMSFLETTETMRRRLAKVKNIYGEDRVPYAGPEYGLKSIPSYDVAVEYLRRVSEATRI